MGAGPPRLDDALLDRVATRHPSPIADAVIALASAASPHERRDRVVEAFRAVLRYLSAIGLAARLARDPGGDADDVRELVDGLRKRSLTDGQWWHLLRELARPWRDRSAAHPLPALVELLARPAFGRDIDSLLGMRKTETVAHGTTGDAVDIAEILAEREPALARMLDATAALHETARLVVPLPPDGDGAQAALALVGATPVRGRHRRIALADGVRLEPGRCALVDPHGLPVLALDPVIRHALPSPGAVAEVFFLDGRGGRGAARYLSLPAASERTEQSVWQRLDAAFAARDDGERAAGAVARPYRGLARFDARDAALFFGRDDEIQALGNRIRSHGLVTLTGPSGSGKSSLLAAGVLPTLAAESAAPYRDGALRARVVTCRPGHDPAAELAAAVAAQLPGRDGDDADPVTRLRAAAGEGLVVLVVDQAEELLTLAPRPEAIAFAEQLVALGGADAATTRVVLSVREDFFASLALLPPLRGVYDRQVMVLGPLDRDAMLRALVEPARRFDVSFEPDLAETMVDALADRPGALPLLQFTADRLWEQRRGRAVLTRATYDELGGVEGALAHHADACVDAMLPAQQEVARQLFLRLVTAEGTRATVHRDELTALAPEAGPALAALETARLVAARQDAGGDAVCELVHEALLAHWPRLAAWRKAEGDGAAHVAQLAAAARAWRQGGRRRDQLWRGDVLAEHRRWRVRASLHLTADETEFVAVSTAAERTGRRRRVAVVAAVGAMLTAITAVALLQRSRAATASRRAAAGEAAAAEGEATARAAAHRAEMQAMLIRARQYAATGHSAEEIAVLRALARPDAGEDARALAVMEGGFIWKAQQRLAMAVGEDAVSTARSADGSTFLVVEPDAVVVFDAATGRERSRLPITDPKFPALVGFSPTGRFMVTCTRGCQFPISGEGADFEVVDLGTGKRIAELIASDQHADPFIDVGALAFAPDDKALAFRHDNRIDAVDSGGAPLGTIPSDCNSGPIAVSAGGRLVAQACGSRLRVTTLGGSTISLPDPPGRWEAIAFVDDRRLLASGDHFAMWDAATGATIADAALPQLGATPTERVELGWVVRGAGRVPTVRIGNARAMLPLRTLFTPAPQRRGDTTLLATWPDRRDWAPLVLAGDVAALGPNESQLPRRPAIPCLTVQGESSHDAILLDRGDRILVDEQELPVAGNATYQQTTVLEAPLRWLRPSTAAAGSACLVWERARSNPAAIAIDRDREPVVAADGSLVLSSYDVAAELLTKDGSRRSLSVHHHVELSPDGKLLAGRDGNALFVLDVATGQVVRSLPVDPDTYPGIYWVADDAVLVDLQSNHTWQLLSIDPSRPLGPKLPDGTRLAMGPSPYALVEDGPDTVVIHLADGAVAARHPAVDAITIVPGPEGLLLARDAQGVALLALDGKRRPIDDDRLAGDGAYVDLVRFSDDFRYLADDEGALWEIATGKQVGTLKGFGAFVDGEAWSISARVGTLTRLDLATGARRELALSLASLPFHASGGDLEVSADRRWLSAVYAVTEEIEARAIWDTDSGALVWIGDKDARLIGDWIVTDGQAFHPRFDVDALLADAGARTNLRVCRDDYRAVAVQQPPPPDTYWAPEDACRPPTTP